MINWLQNQESLDLCWIPSYSRCSQQKVRITCIEDLKDYDVKEPGQPGQPMSRFKLYS